LGERDRQRRDQRRRSTGRVRRSLAEALHPDHEATKAERAERAPAFKV